jgi:magnesium transporter
VHGAAYFAYFMRTMYQSVEMNLDDIAISINKIEESIFTENERKTIEEISSSRRKLFDFESSTRFHKEVLESYAVSSISLFGHNISVYSEIMISDYLKIWNTIEHQKNMLLDLKDTNDFLLNHKTNQMIKSFTALSFVILPLTLVSGFMGMNTIFPESLVKNPYGTVQIAIAMLCISIFVLLYLHIKKWL